MAIIAQRAKEDNPDFSLSGPAEVEKGVNSGSVQISLSVLLCQHLPKHVLKLVP